ncbi:hypothetical protein HanRHA438_Chr11g0508401 [Helianthus annuus]|uniref:Uncharacterized protein n=1 Tax=Helianthus annuus TaxID=4232 RepID=A0A9K3HPR8_HELAN|nr:hypothetical protein HanXRQr2_Chr11g0495811 [Helianthus annuus]KAJ0501917.1 hypothetical protein HanHA300_Chr11g0406611 [Helianthus annuus]KAJ0509849.1 hypothetical protein HanIR_Chr11g0533811 [Helianthus annuus]KAJ0517846.1 hypothetical protein HanHA89_Chr11g0430361 [Helianthus annuus]KAJ0685862.1 hypothetical protein HanLR1_Chr11g0407851 [Helianthus annuus]
MSPPLIRACKTIKKVEQVEWLVLLVLYITASKLVYFYIHLTLHIHITWIS